MSIPTQATEIDEVYDAEAAKNQLGHTSKTVTERHDINRKLVVPTTGRPPSALLQVSGRATSLGPPSRPRPKPTRACDLRGKPR
jgi:hypothetical protein